MKKIITASLIAIFVSLMALPVILVSNAALLRPNVPGGLLSPFDLSSLALSVASPFVVGGSSSSTITGNGSTSTIGGNLIVNGSVSSSQPMTYSRWLIPYFGGGTVVTSNNTTTVGTVFLMQFEVPTNGKQCNGIAYNEGTATAAAIEVMGGIYGPIGANAETAASSSLLVSATGTTPGSASGQVLIALPTTTLNQGRYYVAVQFSTTTDSYLRHPNQGMLTGWTQTYATGAGYIPFFTNLTTTTPTNTGTGFPGLKVRCAS
jgi:hypothetical protein